VEGGADTARGFLEEDLVDRIVLFEGPGTIAAPAIAAPLDRAHIPAGFRPRRTLHFGDDAMREWTRVELCAPGLSPISARGLPSRRLPKAGVCASRRPMTRAPSPSVPRS